MSLLFLLHLGVVLAGDYLSVQKSGKGPAVLLLPALGCPGEMWETTVQYLNENFECHVVSIQGFGSTFTGKSWDMDSLKQEILDYMASEDLYGPILMGHSFGGFLALSLSVSNPGLFSKLIIADAYPFVMASFQADATQEKAMAYAEQVKKIYVHLPMDQRNAQESATLKMAVSDESHFQQLLSWKLASDPNVVAEAQYAYLAADLRPKLEKVHIPVLVLGSWKGFEAFGFTKATVEKNFQDQYQFMENCTLMVSESAKHFIMMDDPKWFMEQLLTFIE